jgi:hypothetical protein
MALNGPTLLIDLKDFQLEFKNVEFNSNVALRQNVANLEIKLENGKAYGTKLSFINCYGLYFYGGIGCLQITADNQIEETTLFSFTEIEFQMITNDYFSNFLSFEDFLPSENISDLIQSDIVRTAILCEASIFFNFEGVTAIIQYFAIDKLTTFLCKRNFL